MMKNESDSDAISATLVLARQSDVENIFVRPVRGNHYEVLTVPFWAYNLSRGDIVEAHPDEDGEGLFIEKVIQRSGNRTVRIVFKTPEKLQHPEAVKLLDYLRERGLVYEIFKPRMLSVNVPSDAEYEALISKLENAPKDADVVWEDGSPNPRKNLDGSNVSG